MATTLPISVGFFWMASILIIPATESLTSAAEFSF